MKNIKNHLHKKSKKLLMFGYKFLMSVENNRYIMNFYKKDHKEYVALYVKEEYRNKGTFKNLKRSVTFITLPECNLEDFFKKQDAKYICPTSTSDYYCEMIESVYGEKRAKRTDIPYINHIYEGCGILYLLGADEKTMSAFMIHPILQNNMKIEESKEIDRDIKHLAQRYSNYANQFLRNSYKNENSTLLEDELYYNKSLKQMLIADKVQNYKDARNNKSLLVEWNDIEEYFMWWFDKLDLTKDQVNDMIKYINF